LAPLAAAALGACNEPLVLGFWAGARAGLPPVAVGLALGSPGGAVGLAGGPLAGALVLVGPVGLLGLAVVGLAPPLAAGAPPLLMLALLLSAPWLARFTLAPLASQMDPMVPQMDRMKHRKDRRWQMRWVCQTGLQQHRMGQLTRKPLERQTDRSRLQKDRWEHRRDRRWQPRRLLGAKRFAGGRPPAVK